MPQVLTLGLELVGFGLLCIAGWMGGTLAYRNQIGVDHRYAGAGKSNEASLTGSAGQQVTVATLDELKVDQMKLVEVAGKRIVIGRSESGLVAFDDRCSHRGASLADGVMICGTVQCPWHGSQFDCATGNVKAGPAKEKIAVYTILQKNNEIVLQL